MYACIICKTNTAVQDLFCIPCGKRWEADRHRAHLKWGKVREAVKAPKKCTDCGGGQPTKGAAWRAPRLSAHHFDYTRPYDVIWLCKACHMKRHMSKGIWNSRL